MKTQLHEKAKLPNTCILDRELILISILENRDPCCGCNADRDICKGRPYGKRFYYGALTDSLLSIPGNDPFTVSSPARLHL